MILTNHKNKIIIKYIYKKMRYFTQEEIDKLKFMETHFWTVVNGKYKIATPVKDNEYVVQVYEEATGEKLYKNWGCNKCVYNIFNKIGKLYFDSIKYLEEQNNLKKETEIMHAYENNKSTESSNSTLEKRRANIAKAREAKNSKKSVDKGN